MEQSQLIDLIKTLRPEEKNQILQFAELTFFNHRRFPEEVAPFLAICLDHPWHLADQQLDKKVLFATLYPSKKFSEDKIDRLMVESHRIIRAFLLTQHYFRPDNEFEQVFDFAEIVRLRGLHTRHQQLLVQLEKIQEAAPWENARHLHRQFLLEYAIHVDDSFHNKVKGDLRVPESLEALDRYYQHCRLGLLCNILLQQKMTHLELPASVQRLLESSEVPNEYLETSPLLRVSHEILALLRKPFPETSDIDAIIQLLRSQEAQLDPESTRKFYTYIRSLCALAINVQLDNDDIRHILFRLYQDNLESGYLYYEGKLHSSLYLAVTVLAIRLGHCDWALNYIERHRHMIIDENDTHDFYRFNLANYYFGVGRYQDCLDHIPDNFTHVNYLLHAKRLEIKALYELQHDLLDYKLDAFKMFLRRTSPKLLSEPLRELNKEFHNFLSQIIHSIPGDKKRAALLEERIRNRKQANEYAWLLEKARRVGG